MLYDIVLTSSINFYLRKNFDQSKWLKVKL